MNGRASACWHRAGVLSDAELLAIFLRVGMKGKTPTDRA